MYPSVLCFSKTQTLSMRDVVCTCTQPDQQALLPQSFVPPQPVPVPGVQRKIEVCIATNESDWEEAFRLVRKKYLERGYDPDGPGDVHFTLHHGLPDTTTFIARLEERIVGTVSVVLDNTLLGLPMESVYGEEVAQLRKEGRRLAEVTCLADDGLGLREFIPVYVALTGLMGQWGFDQGVDTYVITINPRHRAFYRKVMGFALFGPERPLPSVQDHPAVGYLLDIEMIKTSGHDMHQALFGKQVPSGALQFRSMPISLVRQLSCRSSVTTIQRIDRLLQAVQEHRGWVRAWPGGESNLVDLVAHLRKRAC